MPITISDEEQSQERATQDTDGLSQTGVGEEHTVAPEGEILADMEEQPPEEVGETIEIAEHLVDNDERRYPGAEAEQHEPEEGGAGESEQQEPTQVEEPEQPSQPKSDKAAGTEQQQQQQNEVPLDPLEQSLLDILDEE